MDKNPVSKKANKTRRQAERRGRLAEWAALALFLVKGCRPLHRRYRTPLGEIDLILARGNLIIFAEVKARARMEDAAFALTTKQQTRIIRAARWFLSRHPTFHDRAMRFDVVLVGAGARGARGWRGLRHIPNAFSLPDRALW